jgi:pimeloyl-ACP methyl ester carboxylesterase
VSVVLLHALPLDERMWEPQREALAAHEVVAPNLYRLGSTVDEWADGVLRALDGTFAAVGASMGGYCALALARRAPERVAGILLAGAPARADTPERRAARADTIRLVREEGVRALWEDMRTKVLSEGAPRKVVDRAREIALAQDPDGIVAAVAAIRDRPDATDVVASFGGSLLVAAGDQDPFLPVEDARRIADSAPEGRLHVFEGAGHLPSLEQPDRFNALLTEFLVALD